MQADPKTDAQIYRRLLSYSAKYWQLFFLSLTALVVAAATEPLFARFIKPLIDDNFDPAQRDAAKWLPLLILGLFVVRGVASYINDTATALLAGRVVYDLRAEMMAKIMRFPSKYFYENSSAQTGTSVLVNVTAVTEAGFNIITVAVKDGITVMGLLALLFYTNWRLALVCLVILPLVGVGVRLAAKKLSGYASQGQASSVDLMQSLTEILNAQKIVKIYAAQESETRRFLSSANKIRQMALKIVSTSSANSAFVQFLVAGAISLVVFFAGRLALKGEMTAGDFASFMTAMMMLLAPIKRLTNINQSLQRGLAAARDIFKLLDYTVERDQTGFTSTQVQGNVVFKDISFKYTPDSEPVLKGVTLNVPAGMTVGIVGESGGGKSTLINLLPRFLEKTAGSLTVDGIDVSDWNMKSLRKHIAIVTQESYLFNDTVFNNIAYGEMAGSSIESVREAASMANALEFIEALPQGFDTPLGDSGIRLSGGQKQRISIARAFLKNAPILIFDEATSALDNVAEREVQRDMERLCQGRTTFIIAHRLSTLVNADLIIVIDAGVIVEQGTHPALLAMGGKYAGLYNSPFA